MTQPPEQTSAAPWKAHLWTMAKVVLAVILVSIVLVQTTPTDLITLWSQIALPWVPASIATFWAITFITAWRYWLLMERKLSIQESVGITVLQTVIGNFVASSAGAISYVALLRGRHQVQLSQSIASLVLARFGDLMALTVALAASSVVLWPRITPLHWAVVALLVVLLGVIIGLTLLFLFRQPVVNASLAVLCWCRLDKLAFVQSLMTRISVFVEQSPQRLIRMSVPFLALSFALMLAGFAFSYSVLRLFNIPLGGWEVLFSMAIIQLLAVIPVQVLGGLGVYEVTALYLYGLLGVATPVAVPLVVSSRLYLYLLNLLLLLYLPLESRLGATRSPRAIQEL